MPRAYGIPVRRAEPGQGRHEVDAVVGVQRAGQLLGVGRVLDDPEPVAQPLDGGAGDEDRRLERVRGLPPDLPGDRRQQALGRRRHGGALVDQHERAGAVRVLAEAGLDAALAEQRRLLVARDAGDGHVCEVLRPAELATARPNLGQRALRDAEEVEQLRMPAVLVDVVEQRPRGVRGVGDVLPAELEQQPGVDRPEHRSPLASLLLEPVDVAQQPLDLGRREVRVEHEARPSRGCGPPRPPRAARRSGPPCAGPATRAPGAAARRSRDPSRPRSRAGW